MEWMQLLGILAAGLIIWYMIRLIRHQPEMFSSKKINKSFRTMGILGLLLIAFIALCVMLLR